MSSKQIKTALPFALALLVVAGSTVAAAWPGPKYWGDIYTYLDEQGNVVGTARIDCSGQYHQQGIQTANYYYGQATCG